MCVLLLMLYGLALLLLSFVLLEVLVQVPVGTGRTPQHSNSSNYDGSNDSSYGGSSYADFKHFLRKVTDVVKKERFCCCILLLLVVFVVVVVVVAVVC